jgi:ribosomal protein S18
MSATWRVLTIGVLAATVAVAVSAQASDPRIGTWKLDAEKSKFSPGPAPKSLTLKIEAAGQGEKVTAEIVNADGTSSTTEYTANYDGKDYPLKGSTVADMVSLKRIDTRTTERMDKKGGKVVQTFKRVVSEDGKTMTSTTTGTNAQGQALNNVSVFRKQ